MKQLFLVILLGLAHWGSAQKKVVDVSINLKDVKNGICKVVVTPPGDSDVSSIQFPKSVPGAYEIEDFSKYILSPGVKLANGNWVEAERNGNAFSWEGTDVRELVYQCKQSNNPYGQILPEGTMFDAEKLLVNWNALVGYFEGKDLAYQIKLIKPREFFGATSLSKKILNDSTDVFFANSYDELVHGPVLYAVPDTTSFTVGESNFTISCYSTSPRLKSASIRKRLEPAVRKCVEVSKHVPENYNFIYLIDDFKIANGIIALEHPKSSVTIYSSSYNDSSAMVTTSIHELCHSLFTPLFIRSKQMSKFNYSEPECDQHLWFYEGVVEYLSTKLCLQAGAIDTTGFVRSLHSYKINMENMKLSDLSRNIYSKMGKKHFMNMYAKGSLVAYLLDLELIEKSDSRMSLLTLMQKMQDYQSEHGDFNAMSFFDLLSELSGVDLHAFFDSYVDSKAKIDFNENLKRIGCRIETIPYDTLAYSYNIKAITYNPKSDRNFFVVKNSVLNRQTGIKNLQITKIDGEPFNAKLVNSLIYPDKSQQSITYLDGGKETTYKVSARKERRTFFNRKVSNIASPNPKVRDYYWLH
jgi:predicted metalloprotease with PDZ domain